MHGKEILPQSMNIITFDGLKVQVTNQPKIFTNRDEVYPYHAIDAMPTEFDFKFEFMASIAFYEIEPQILKNIIDLR